jgi:hypothetical protein
MQQSRYFHLAILTISLSGEKRRRVEPSAQSDEEIAMIIKPNRIEVAAVMVALATAGVAVPAFAHTKATASWDTCYSLANERGAGRLPAPALGGAFASASVPKHTSLSRPATRFRTELGAQYRLPNGLQRYDGYQPDRQIVGLHD